MLILSDQQLITGISILVSGYSQVSCLLQAYHCLLTVDLAWFSSITHLTTLTILCHYFQERPALRLWRVCCVGITAIMLGISLESTGYAGKNLDPATQAWCLLYSSILPKHSSITPSCKRMYVAAMLGILTFSNSTRMVQLFPATIDSAWTLFRTRPSNIIKGCTVSAGHRAVRSLSQLSKVFWSFVFRLLLSLYRV